MRAAAVAALAGALSACAITPGMNMNEGAADARAQANRPATPVKDEGGKPGANPNRVQTTTDAAGEGIVLITPEVLRRHAEARAARQRSAIEDPLAERAKAYAYRVAPFDVLSVTVWDHPELTIPAGEFRSAEATGHPVYSDGTMFYPHVGVIEAGGKTLPQIREELTRRLTRVIQNPQLDIRVAAFRGHKVQVTGEVAAPSAVPITDVPMRALDAINFAKGFSPEADMQNVKLTRDGKTFVLDLQAVNERGEVGNNWLLVDGDILHVPDRRENRVFVLGEVREQMARPMVRGRLTLADALSDAQGMDQTTSNPSRIYVIRGSFEKPTIYKLDASSPDALLLAVQFQLEPRDVVYVSAYELTRWNRVISQILPTIQVLWQTFDLTQRVVR